MLRGARNSDYHIGIGLYSPVATRSAGSGRGGASGHGGRDDTTLSSSISSEVDDDAPPTVCGLASKVICQLMLDNEHADARENCGHRQADTSSCWRVSAWELHPVMQFYACSRLTLCVECSADWRKLDDQQ